MKRFLIAVFICMTAALAQAQDCSLNDVADSLTGTYYVSHEGENSKVKIFKAEDGTFSAKVIWLEHRLDENGNVRLDVKNPDKSLRDTPCDQITIMEGLEYNPDKKRWDSGKVYDPTRGIRANVTCSFDSPETLRIRGSLMGFGETVFWKKLAE